MTETQIQIQLGKRFRFNVLDVIIIKETEKAVQIQSISNPKHTLWMPKKSLKESNEVPGIFSLQSWFRFDDWGQRFVGNNMRHIMSSTWF